MIKVLIVEDSKLAAFALRELLAQDPAILIVGIAQDGRQALEMTKRLKPHLITMDIHMPRMDGYEATKKIMGECPTPILVISSSVFKEGMNKVFKALSYGALDVVDKNAIEGFSASRQEAHKQLVDKVKKLSKVRVITHPLSGIESRMSNRTAVSRKGILKRRIIGIVSSTGGTEALRIILKPLAESFPCPITVVQHITSGFVQGLAEWLDRETALKVKIAEDGETLEAGRIYLAPSHLHMKVTKAGKISLVDGQAVHFQKPSGTILLQSIAESYGAEALGVVLTGMGSDGAEGLKRIYEAKGYTLTQDEKSSVVFGMPKSAIELGAVQEILPLCKIAAALMKEVDG